MRQIRFSDEAVTRLNQQLDYLLAENRPQSAQNMLTRVSATLGRTLATYPRTGRHIRERDVWEAWIPGTRLIVWYTFTDQELFVITFWHAAQMRLP